MMHVFSENENFDFSPNYGPKNTQNRSFFMIFGCGASGLIDGRTEFNVTFTYYVIESRDDVRLFGKCKFLFFTKLRAKNPPKIGNVS